jgi:hypothetical protein
MKCQRTGICVLPVGTCTLEGNTRAGGGRFCDRAMGKKCVSKLRHYHVCRDLALIVAPSDDLKCCSLTQRSATTS